MGCPLIRACSLIRSNTVGNVIRPNVFDLISEHALISRHPLFPEILSKKREMESVPPVLL